MMGLGCSNHQGTIVKKPNKVEQKQVQKDKCPKPRPVAPPPAYGNKIVRR